MKRPLLKRARFSLALLGASGILLAGAELSCFSAGASGLLSSVDLCFLFNCNDGAIGGLLTFCSQTDTNLITGQPLENPTPLLSDCQ